MKELPDKWRRVDSGCGGSVFIGHGVRVRRQVADGCEGFADVFVDGDCGCHDRAAEVPLEVFAELLREAGWTCAAPTGRPEPDLSGVARDLAAHILDRPKRQEQGDAMPQTFESWAADLIALAKDARELLGEE